MHDMTTTKKTQSLQRGSTLYLRVTIAVIALVVITLCLFALPAAYVTDKTGGYRPIIIGMYVSAIPFFWALRQALNLLGYIDRNKAFSRKSVHAIKSVKYCALIISALFAAGMPYIYLVADADDAPGILATALVILFASTVIATTAAVLQALFQHAVDIKKENDLTV